MFSSLTSISRGILCIIGKVTSRILIFFNLYRVPNFRQYLSFSSRTESQPVLHYFEWSLCDKGIRKESEARLLTCKTSHNGYLYSWPGKSIRIFEIGKRLISSTSMGIGLLVQFQQVCEGGPACCKSQPMRRMRTSKVHNSVFGS